MENNADGLTQAVADLLNEYSMPEVVATLVAHSHFYHETLRKDTPSESMEWLGWSRDLAAALRNAEGEEEAEEMVAEQLAVLKQRLPE